MIKANRVTVDGEPAHLGQKIDVETAHVEIDGVPLPVKPGLVYAVLNKPVDVVSTTSDPQGRTTVVDVVDLDERIYPVGRLDANSEGLLVLTNDGDLTEILTHPRHQVTKTYLAMVDGKPSRQTITQITSGVELDDGPAQARSARIIDHSQGRTLVEIVMTEGRKREVRRIFETVGHPVKRLVRTAIGSFTDRDLKPGEWRHLTVEEVRELYASAEQ
jgi:23S rRNA pseudouridine2605 synthase